MMNIKLDESSLEGDSQVAMREAIKDIAVDEILEIAEGLLDD